MIKGKIEKFLLSFFLVFIFAVYVVFLRASSENIYAVPASATKNESSVLVPVPVYSTTSTKSFKDGEYTGAVADAYYGNVQVKAIIQNGKITGVQFLEYPSDRGTSVMINTQAMPILRAEVIQSQNAQVDIVSGATHTSLAFQESLADALAQAKN